MVVQKVRMMGDEVLRKKCEEITTFDGELQKMITDLDDILQYLQHKHGVGRGLAAPQIGYKKRIIRFRLEKRNISMVNPKILSRSDETMKVWDDCFSVGTDFLVELERAVEVEVQYQDEEGTIHHENFEGDLAQLVQHEIDHLDGILSVDYISDTKKIKHRNAGAHITERKIKKSTKKKIGILGGISHESTARYYKGLHEAYFSSQQDYYYPEVVVYSLDFQKFTDFEDAGDMPGYISYIMEGISALEKVGVEMIIMAANSPHSVFETVQGLSSLPMLHIAEPVMQEAKKRNLKNMLLLGIKFTMQNGFYQEIATKHGMKLITPSPEHQEEVNTMIFDHLCIGERTPEVKQGLLDIIGSYQVDGVILGCTELPLILHQSDLDIAVLDTLNLHINTILEMALDN